jgi:hypothetical protein
MTVQLINSSRVLTIDLYYILYWILTTEIALCNNFNGSSGVAPPTKISSNFLNLRISKSGFRTVDGVFLRWFTSLNKEIQLYKTRDSCGILLVSIATGVRAGHQKNRGLFSGSGNRFFCSRQLVDMPCGPRSLLFNEHRTLVSSGAK